MRGSRSQYLALAAALALSGCSYTDNVLDWATGTTSPTNSSSSLSIPIAPSAAERAADPTISSSTLAPAVGSTTTSTTTYSGGTTFVGQKVQTLRSELGQLQGNISRHQQEAQAARQSLSGTASSYFSLIAGINARLQGGTTPGNPQLVAQWGQAQSLLDRMGTDVARLNTAANSVAADASFGNYLLGEIRSAYALQGGIESDRDALRQTEVQTQGSLTNVDQLLNNLSDDINRQSGYVANERNNLVTLALAIQNGQLYGPSLANRNFNSAGPAPVAAAPRAARLSV